MSVNEKIMEKLDTMSDENREKALAIITILAGDNDSGSELAKIIGEDELLAAVKEIEDGEYYGPFDSAEEAFRFLMED
ncbi:MAG: hypothetical protein LBM41_02925 [Ruminococcus sp.]|jgi:wyosine [tRNA(Phe)-imidazoG37] synthetase (radical SAM superfamily)|nr:hypothetical protein [Ruminococcus sp.]